MSLRQCPVVPGRAYSFEYPRYNYSGLPDRTEVRRINVISVRDLKREPLDAETFELRPTLNRGRWLVRAEDLDKGEERSFYAERMSDIQNLEEQSSAEYIVIDFERVRFSDEDLGAAIAFRQGRQSGAVYGRMVRHSSQSVAPVLPRKKRRIKSS